MGIHRAEIINSNYSVPSKIMVIQPGVELIEPNGGRHVKSDSIVINGRLKVSDYKKMVNLPKT